MTNYWVKTLNIDNKLMQEFRIDIHKNYLPKSIIYKYYIWYDDMTLYIPYF